MVLFVHPEYFRLIDFNECVWIQKIKFDICQPISNDQHQVNVINGNVEIVWLEKTERQEKQLLNECDFIIKFSWAHEQMIGRQWS